MPKKTNNPEHQSTSEDLAIDTYNVLEDILEELKILNSK